MRMSWDKMVQYVGTKYGQDISNELQNKSTMTIPKPTHSQAIMTRHATRVTMIHDGQRNLQAARAARLVILEAAAAAVPLVDTDAPMNLAILQNEITQGTYELDQEVPIKLMDSEKTAWSNAWRTYRERSANLEKHQGQAFTLIQGQCTQLLMDKMKQDVDWSTVSVSYNPLTLF